MASTMRILKKVEPPRPLKSQMMAIKLPQDSTQVTADSLISIAESIASALVTKPTDIGLQNNLIWLSHQLQTHGPRIEINYRDSLNKIFVVFRNASQNEDTNYNIRLTLLQLIELRANNWQSSDGANSYYKTKVSHIQESVPIDAMILSPSPEPFACPMTPTQLLLGPGEVVRTSGKYNRPTKIPGKNYSKDEVVIRNADSGKVMGIKGRRVHMIEELSETIISFQRVNPGAKERLVQITGPTEEKINYAKQLIEDTIRRNASPVRSMEQLSMISLVGGRDCDQDSVDSLGSMTLEESHPRNLRHSRSVNDASVEDYKYTVVVGDDIIKISGSSLHYITLAKLELERYFSSDNFKPQDRSDLSDEVFKESSPSSTLSDEIAVGFGNGFEAPKEPITPDDVTTKPLIERRKFFSRKSSEIKEDPVINGFYKYSHKTLVDYSQSPYCSVTPKDIANITRNNINKKQVNVREAIRRWNATNRANQTQDNNNFIRQHFFSSIANNHLPSHQSSNNNHTNNGSRNNMFCVQQLNGNINNFH